MDNTQNIIEACEKGDLEEVKNLIEKGADIEAKDNKGNTPLIMASCYGHVEIAKFLLEQGADLEAKDNNGDTPLFWASYYGKIEVVKFLVEKGADLEAKDKYGKICYYYLNEENKKIIDLLLKDIEERKSMIKPCKKRYPSGV